MQLKEDMEKANKTIKKAGAGKDLTAGDLFGVRAIEKGFYGGVSQVDLHAAPTRTMKPNGLSSTYSTVGSPNPTESVISLFNQATTNAPRSGPRLQPSFAEIQRTRPEPEVDMSAVMPPSPTRQSFVDNTASREPYGLTRPGRSYDPQPAERRDSHKNSNPSTPLMGSTESLMRNMSPNRAGPSSEARLSQSPLTRHPKERQLSHESVSTSPRKGPPLSIHNHTNVSNNRSAPRPTPTPPTYMPNTKTQSPTGRRIVHAQDSVRRPSVPSYSNASDMERQRDHMHYDPTRTNTRARAASIQGRAVNFDRPRDSPFSDANAARSGSAHSRGRSGSSSGSSGSNGGSESSFDSAIEQAYTQAGGNRVSRYPGMMPLTQNDGIRNIRR